MPRGHRPAGFLAFASRLCLASVCLAAVCLAQAQTEPAGRAADPAKAAAARSDARVAPRSRSAAKGPAGKTGEKPKQQAEAEALPPRRPPTPEQLPPTRPTVTYRNGQLSILANNSTMSDVLNAVRAQIGAQFEMSGISSADRVYAKLGPGAPKDVLAALLDGSRFNFAILGSATDPAGVARVVLMPRAGGATSTSMSASNPVPPAYRPMPAQAQDETDEEMPPEEAPAEEVQQEQPQPEPQQQQQQPGQVRTPEQLLQELQRMQQQQEEQQRQQQRQNLNGQQPQQIPDEQPPQ